VDGVGPSFLPGEVVPVETDGWCGPVDAVLVDENGVETAMELVSDLPDLLPYRVPDGVANGPYTLRVLGYLAAEFPVEVGGGVERAPVGDSATLGDVEALVVDDDSYYPDGCGSGMGTLWEVEAVLDLDGTQGPNHLLRVEPVGSGNPFGTWVGIPAGATAIDVGASLVGDSPREGCITGDLYDPTFAVRPLDTRCAPLRHGAGYGVPPTGAERGCTTSTGSPLAALAALAALARRLRRPRY
jgi:hypothetical protein